MIITNNCGTYQIYDCFLTDILNRSIIIITISSSEEILSTCRFVTVANIIKIVTNPSFQVLYSTQ